MPPQGLELGHQLRVLVGDVDGLGEVGRQVEQRPSVGSEVVAAGDPLALDRELPADVVGRGLPVAVDDRAGPDHLEVLRLARARGPGIVERGPQAGAVDRLLVDAVDHVRGVDAHGVEHGGHQVDGVAELVSHHAGRRRRIAAGPVRDEGGPHTTQPRVALPQPQRRVARPCPTPGIVVVGPEAAEVVDVRQRVGQVVEAVVREAVLVQRPGGPALGAGAVVADQQHQRVVEKRGGPQEVEQSPDLCVGVRQVASEDLHHPGVEPALVCRQFVPGRHPGRTLADPGPVGHDPGVQLARERRLAPRLPAGVEPSAVGVDERPGGLVGSVHGAGREVAEEAAPGRGLLLVLDEADRPVGQVLGQVVALHGVRGGSTKPLSDTRSGVHWLVSPPRKP